MEKTPSSPSAGKGGRSDKDQHNILRVSTRSKDTRTHVDVIRASYPLKLASTKSTRVAPPLHLHPTLSADFIDTASDSSDTSAVSQKDENTTTIVNTKMTKKHIPPPPRIVYMIAYGGGLLKDDHPHLQIELGPLSRLVVLGQGSTKISKCPPNHPPASQTIHATVGPGAVYLFLGPPVVASEDSSAFLKHEIVLQAAPSPPPPTSSRTNIQNDQNQDLPEDDQDDTLPNCVALDWIAGGRGEEERWKARRIEWRMVVRWSELDEWPNSTSSSSPRATQESVNPPHESTSALQQDELDDDDDDFFGEDPRDIADRLAGGPVIFRDGFLLEDDQACPKPRSPPPQKQQQQSPPATSPSSQPPPQFSTSYAASVHPHATIGTLFIMGPKTERLQRAILRRFEKMTIFPGQKGNVRPDYPILWSATSIQVPRPKPKTPSPHGTFSARSHQKTTMMTAVVVKMATQGVEQMQDFLKTLFEEKHLEDTSHFEDEQGTLSVVDELFGGRVVWDRVLR